MLVGCAWRPGQREITKVLARFTEMSRHVGTDSPRWEGYIPPAASIYRALQTQEAQHSIPSSNTGTGAYTAAGFLNRIIILLQVPTIAEYHSSTLIAGKLALFALSSNSISVINALFSKCRYSCSEPPGTSDRAYSLHFSLTSRRSSSMSGTSENSEN